MQSLEKMLCAHMQKRRDARNRCGKLGEGVGCWQRSHLAPRKPRLQLAASRPGLSDLDRVLSAIRDVLICLSYTGNVFLHSKRPGQMTGCSGALRRHRCSVSAAVS